MSIEQSVKEFTFISYFLFFDNFLRLQPFCPLSDRTTQRSQLLPIAPPELLYNHVEVLIKEARDQAKMLSEGAEREAIATAVVAVRLFWDSDESLLAGGRSIGWRSQTRYQ